MKKSVNLPGQDIDGRAFPEYVWNADLVYYDGPFVSLYRRDKGSDAIFFWVDSVLGSNRWASVEVGRVDLEQYLQGNLSLREILDKSVECYIFNVGPRGRKTKFRKLSSKEFPKEYLPDDDSYLYEEIATDEALRLLGELRFEYKILLDGEEIYMDDLATIPKVYQQLYSFHYGLDHLDRAAIQNRLRSAMNDWTSGMSAVNLFSGLKNLTPSVHRARVSELKYASPGFVKLDLLKTVASEIAKVVATVHSNAALTEAAYKACYKYFQDQRISGFDSEDPAERAALTPSQTARIEEFVVRFYGLLALGKYEGRFDMLGVQPLGRLRAMLAYYRRVKVLIAYIDAGTLDVPAVR